jgi:hypothetical protein
MFPYFKIYSYKAKPPTTPDFYIGTIGNAAGQPVREQTGSNHAVVANQEYFVPQYLFYLFQHAHNMGAFKKYLHGTTREALTVEDTYKAMLEVMQHTFKSRTAAIKYIINRAGKE